MEVLLDTSFIVSCVRRKIDFVLQLEEQGFKVILPKEVYEELKDLKKKSAASHETRIAIGVAMELFEKIKIKKMVLGHEKVDNALIRRGKQGYYIATLDRVIKRSVPRRVVILDAQNKIGVELD